MKKIIFTCLLSGAFLTNLQAQTTVFTEDFQGGIPATWTIIVNDTNTVHSDVDQAYNAGWITVTDPENDLDTIASATSYFETPAQASRWLITPSITLGAYGNIIKWEGKSQDPSFPDGYLVMISTTDTQIASFDTLTNIYPEGENWTQRQINLSEEGYFSQPVHIAFVLRTYNAYKLYLDDISMVINDPVGLSELAQSSMTIHPNPASHSFSVKGDTPENVRIYSTSGTLILDQQFQAGQSVDVSTLVNGTYIVELSGEKGISRQRFVKI